MAPKNFRILRIGPVTIVWRPMSERMEVSMVLVDASDVLAEPCAAMSSSIRTVTRSPTPRALRSKKRKEPDGVSPGQTAPSLGGG